MCVEAYETSQMESITRIALCSATLHVGWLHQSLDSYTVESSISLRLSTAIQYEGVYSHTAITEQHSGVTECESELKPDSMPISVGLNWSFGVSHHPNKAVKQQFIASRRPIARLPRVSAAELQGHARDHHHETMTKLPSDPVPCYPVGSKGHKIKAFASFQSLFVDQRGKLSLRKTSVVRESCDLRGRRQKILSSHQVLFPP